MYTFPYLSFDGVKEARRDDELFCGKPEIEAEAI
jgi:hypothetical protein